MDRHLAIAALALGLGGIPLAAGGARARVAHEGVAGGSVGSGPARAARDARGGGHGGRREDPGNGRVRTTPVDTEPAPTRGGDADGRSVVVFGQTLPHAAVAKVSEQLKHYLKSTKGRGKLTRILRRRRRLHGVMRRWIEARGLPAFVEAVPLAESGLIVDMRSFAGAVGMWQLMPETAKEWGLIVRDDRDDRLEPVRASRAATNYLRYLHERFRDWPLALAAYNAGPERIAGRLRRSDARTYWDLDERGQLPEETSEFVPKVIALALVLRDVDGASGQPPREEARWARGVQGQPWSRTDLGGAR